jgi:hypothetical protein
MRVGERSEHLSYLIRFRGHHNNIAVQAGRIGTVRVVDIDQSGRDCVIAKHPCDPNARVPGSTNHQSPLTSHT